MTPKHEVRDLEVIFDTTINMKNMSDWGEGVKEIMGHPLGWVVVKKNTVFIPQIFAPLP